MKNWILIAIAHTNDDNESLLEWVKILRKMWGEQNQDFYMPTMIVF